MTEPDANRDDPETPAARWHSLWLLTLGPAFWTMHFLASYITAAIWCAKFAGRAGSLETVRWLIGGYTAVALVGICLVSWFGYRQHKLGQATLPHDADTAGDRHRFLGFSTLLLCGLSFVATVYIALTVVFIGTCE
ncbi:hypothetical protein IQ22_04053 [Pseudomonas duriflava]|uniref:Uncharacterized protein n=1 Tax=Pseudomonas duriflava TaxID=459528 RepID=A0A562PXS9_9PSED|nr:hypothetical protein [Pseudomonas duriflava]TWI49251.1 hypothetical protein IQ22_04053 [Pseudomonas duriflava]